MPRQKQYLSTTWTKCCLLLVIVVLGLNYCNAEDVVTSQHLEINQILCPLEVDPVCSMGITFQNKCIATCQGYHNYTNGYCQVTSGKAVKDGSLFYSSSLPVNVTDIIKNDKGFYYIGRGKDVKFSETPKVPSLLPEYETEHEYETEVNNTEKIHAVKVLIDGSLLIKSIELQNNHSLDENRFYNYRDLAVIGEDSRRIVPETTSLPYARIGEFDYQKNVEGGCTGTVVGSDYVLTAGHCVYDLKRGQFNLPLQFSPGRSHGISGTVNPFSSWKVSSATTYDAYTLKGDIRYDIAVVKLKKNSYGSIGDRVGNLPLKTAPCEFDKVYGVAGYPADKLDGTMWISQPCSHWSYQCSKAPKQLLHQCDTYGGFSGAPIYSDSDENAIVGVHTHGYPTQYSWNGGVAIDSYHLTNLLEWAGIQSQNNPSS